MAVVAILFVTSGAANGEDRFLAKIQEIQQEVDVFYEEQADRPWESMPDSCEAHQQSVESRLPKQVISILQIALGRPASRKVDMANVREVVAGLEQHNQGIQDEFLSNIASYFLRLFGQSTIFADPEYASYSDSDSESDSPPKKPKHSELELKTHIWQKFVEQRKHSMCYGFREENDENILGQQISELRKLKQTENIDDKKFNELVVNADQSIAPVYSAAFFCQFIDGIVAGANEEDAVTLEINSSGVRSTFSATPWTDE